MSKESIEILKEFQNREKSDRVCCICGEPISVDRVDTTAYCSLCTYIKRDAFENRYKPERTDAGYFVLINSKICKARCKRLNGFAYANKEQDYIYLDLEKIDKKRGEINFIARLLFIINHEVMHFVVNKLESSKASTLLDSPFMRKTLDEINGEITIHSKIPKEDLRKEFYKWMKKAMMRY